MLRCIGTVGILIAVVAIGFSPADAQTDGADVREVWVGGMVPGIEGGYAWGVSPGTLVGVQAGVLPQTGLTLVPDPDGPGQPDLDEVVHAAVFVRLRPADRWEVDVGVRGGLADVWPCPASDCYPALFGGGYVQAMAGWERFKLGPRLSAGWVGETRESSDGETFFLALYPLVARLTFPL